MKNLVMIMLIVMMVGQAFAGDKIKIVSSKKSLPRENFEKRYQETFGEKPSNKIWTLGMNPKCVSGGGSHCSGGTCKGNY